MSTQTRADTWCNCQATVTNGGPWHPLGDTPSCPDWSPQDVLRWLVSMDDPQDVIGRESRRAVTLSEIIQRARAGSPRQRDDGPSPPPNCSSND